jgi:hypothetical protein
METSASCEARSAPSSYSTADAQGRGVPDGTAFGWGDHMKNPADMAMIQQLIADTVRAGGDSLDIEYKDQHEEVCAMRGPVGFGIARFPSGGKEATTLRRALYEMAKRRSTVTIDEVDYDVRVRIYDSFGEDAFRAQLTQRGRAEQSAPPARGHRRAPSKHAARRRGRGG